MTHVCTAACLGTTATAAPALCDPAKVRAGAAGGGGDEL